MILVSESQRLLLWLLLRLRMFWTSVIICGAGRVLNWGAPDVLFRNIITSLKAKLNETHLLALLLAKIANERLKIPTSLLETNGYNLN